MVRASFCVLILAVIADGQVLNNQYLNGKYYFRQLSVTAGAQSPTAFSGSMTFDGAGKFTYGTYSVDAAGFVIMDSPLKPGTKMNARVGSEALVGSATESTDGSYDLLVAIPAPKSAPAFSGTYWTSTLEFPARNAFFGLTTAAGGKLSDFSAKGHAASVIGGSPQTQAVTGASYVINADGTGTFSFGNSSNSSILSANWSIFVSNSGNLVLGGSGNDILIGVKSANSATWNGDYWGAGLRYDPTDAAPVSAYSGSVAARNLGFVTWSRRYKAVGSTPFDFTGINRYTVGANGSGTAELAQVGLGGAGFVGASNDATAYEIYFGATMAPLAGTGVFLHPRGVVNTASFAPAGTPIAPDEFVTMFGSGLATTTQRAATANFPTTLAGVTVSINGTAAQIYSVAPDRVNVIVPAGTKGPTASIMVQNQNGGSNAVTVPVAATAPGIFALDQTGAGAGAILHTDFSVVNDANPARRGEIIAIYLTGLGAVNPPSGGLSTTVIPGSSTCDDKSICVLIGGHPTDILYMGLAPGLPGLYQINAQVPSLATGGKIPLAIVTPNAVHDQVYVPIQ
jgi:uncharacterized protein (TIGR03437 family)